MNQFAERLKRLRHENKYSVKYVCEKLSIPETTYREWEIGRQIKGHSIYIKIASLYNIPLHELMTGEKVSNDLVCEQIKKIENDFFELKKIVNSLA